MAANDSLSPPAVAAAVESGLSVDEKYALLRSVGEECITEDDLKNLVLKKPRIRCYDGFEPSGRMHIAQGIFKAINVNKCTTAGCEFVFWVADWFALMNDKVGGELEKIRIVGNYLVEVWSAAGMKMSDVVFLWSSDEINKHAEQYWKIVLDIGRRNSIARIKKCCTIMGKTEGTLSAAQILYPLMQCADVFFLKADICQLGLDQRKVNMLAREYCDLIGRKLKPVILSHHMLSGLKKGQAKMSKSDPDSAIFMEDTKEDVERKIRNAYCPRIAQSASAAAANEDGLGEGSDEKNPVLDYVEHILLSRPDSVLTIAGHSFADYASVEAAFLAGTFDEDALKGAVIEAINGLLEPVREHFRRDARAATLLEQVKSFRKGPTAAADPVATSSGSGASDATPPTAVAWVPAAGRLPLDTAVGIAAALNQFLAEQPPEAQALLITPEWSATARDDFTGEEKNVTAALQLNTLLIQGCGLDKRVRVVSQSELIMSNRDEYWVTAINVGRKHQLRDIEASLQGEIQNAGQVIACLMRVADSVLLKATHVVTTTFDLRQHDLMATFTPSKPVKEIKLGTLIPPVCDPKSTAPLGADDVLFADDTQMDIQRKVKRAYCAPNESENGIVALAAWLIGSSSCGKIDVRRPESNGGDITYTSAEALKASAGSGELHPGDLKAAVTAALLEATQQARDAATSSDGKKLSQVLRNAEKKLSKAAAKSS